MAALNGVSGAYVVATLAPAAAVRLQGRLKRRLLPATGEASPQSLHGGRSPQGVSKQARPKL